TSVRVGGPCKVSLAPRQLYDFFFVNPHTSKLRRDAWLEHCHRLEAIRVEVRRYSGHPGASSASVRSWAKSPTPACSSRATESIVPAPYRQPPPSPSICQLALIPQAGFAQVAQPRQRDGASLAGNKPGARISAQLACHRRK